MKPVPTLPALPSPTVPQWYLSFPVWLLVVGPFIALLTGNFVFGARCLCSLVLERCVREGGKQE